MPDRSLLAGVALVSVSLGACENGSRKAIRAEDFGKILDASAPEPPAQLLAVAREGDIALRSSLVKTVVGALTERKVKLAEAGIPVLLEVMKTVDYKITDSEVLCPSLEAAWWLRELTTSHGMPEYPNVDAPGPLTLFESYRLRPELFEQVWGDCASGLHIERQNFESWYAKRKGKLRFWDSKWEYERRFYGEGDEVEFEAAEGSMRYGKPRPATVGK
jgi:hypothetical protein